MKKMATQEIKNNFSSIPTDLYINGNWVQSSSGKRIDIFDPSTESVITSVADATTEDGIMAVNAAQGYELKFSAKLLI